MYGDNAPVLRYGYTVLCIRMYVPVCVVLSKDHINSRQTAANTVTSIFAYEEGILALHQIYITGYEMIIAHNLHMLLSTLMYSIVTRVL